MTVAAITKQLKAGSNVASDRNLSTAHQAWEQRWADAETRRDWLIPETLVVNAVDVMKERGIKTVLDIGCGVGRHAIYLADQGFQVTGIDLSSAGLEVARDAAEAAGVSIELRTGSFIELPFPDGGFDLALAWNVIYHGDGKIVRQALDEIRRILTPDGLFLGTMISKRHNRYGDGREIRPDTFIVDDDDEKAHAHFYCNDRELISLLSGFQLLTLQDREQREPGTWHWEFLAKRTPVT